MIEDNVHTAQREVCHFTGFVKTFLINYEVKKRKKYGCIVHDKIYTMHVEN